MKYPASLTLALVTCLVVAVSSQYEEGLSCTPTAGSAAAFYENPNDSDCSLFYTCYNDLVYSLRCAPGLVFNNRSLLCDFPSQFPECSLPSPNIGPAQLTFIDQSTTCTLSCIEGVDITYPHATPDAIDCTKFYMCSGGNLYEGSCAQTGSDYMFYESFSRSCSKYRDEWNINCPNGKKRRRRSVEELKAGRRMLF